MQNVNYNLLKMLHNTLDDIWRLEKYYVRDAKKAKCHSQAALKEMLKNEKKHAEALKKEIAARVKAGKFN